ncbi:unnamed protein product [Hydatigera taeniaeformis]|uniref:Uncharacterized protein n=1 Tax=Hydatigena taeniaeformis TaxID=6205 RepID=A0A0R3XBP3_HYDTA|nr:unnamed protein product [Hydatigera taeniaeformis]
MACSIDASSQATIHKTSPTAATSQATIHTTSPTAAPSSTTIHTASYTAHPASPHPSVPTSTHTILVLPNTPFLRLSSTYALLCSFVCSPRAFYTLPHLHLILLLHLLLPLLLLLLLLLLHPSSSRAA